MASVTDSVADVRSHAQLLFATIEVSRIVVVDDEYALRVEDLVGICDTLDPTTNKNISHLENIHFESDREIWTDQVRTLWDSLGHDQRQQTLHSAQRYEASTPIEEIVDGQHKVDATAARLLDDVLDPIGGLEYMKLSLAHWRAHQRTLLGDDLASKTVFLFDLNFDRETPGSQDVGISLIRDTQLSSVGYCGLISHTVQRGSEVQTWERLANEHNLIRDKFVVIAKERLTGDRPDYYGFLAMLRLAALTERYGQAKASAWRVFEESVAEAKRSVERLSVLDFDRIVFRSSRREGIWEPDTLFRVFGILMRREARSRLHQAEDVPTAFAAARRVSAMPDEIATALQGESPSQEALRMQRFETYESAEELNQRHTPIDLGDIFEKEGPNGHRRYILLVQPCDLMVREDGKRNYDSKLGRTGAFVELVVDSAASEKKASWGELSFYHEHTGRSAFLDFAQVHQVRLAVLDLCAVGASGMSEIDVDATCPSLLIEPWKERYRRLQQFFRTALGRYDDMGRKQISRELMLLALPIASSTVRLSVTVDGRAVAYNLRRVLRLRQPWSGAMLTAFNQYQSRAAFEHPFEHHRPA